jgi:Acyl-CoA dehydrogenase, N-terminal domain
MILGTYTEECLRLYRPAGTRDTAAARDTIREHPIPSLALLSEILGRYPAAPVIFGTAAPDTGNMEMLAAYGTEDQKRRWLDPLLNQEIFSAYSMTEPQGGSDQGAARGELPGPAHHGLPRHHQPDPAAGHVGRRADPDLAAWADRAARATLRP